jgi:bacillolysin
LGRERHSDGRCQLPGGQASFLHFQHWRLLDYSTAATSNFDAGTVEVDDIGNANPPVDTATLPWVNGPADTIAGGSANPAAGRLGFGRDSRGYIASRLDLSSFAGATIKPQFTMNTDNTLSFLGWWVDDVVVYTCNPPPPVVGATPSVVGATPTITGKTRVGKKLTAHEGSWAPAGVAFAYQWLRNGTPVSGATGTTYKLKNGDKGKKISVRVTGSKAGHNPATLTSAQTAKIKKKKKKH